MKLSVFSRNLIGPWMIHPELAAAMLPIVHGIISGNLADFDESERKASRKVSCSDFYTGDKMAARPFEGKSVFVTYLDGTMTKHDTCYAYGTRTIASELLAADGDPEIVGHIIVADSGGGAADSVPELADAIRQLTKPVVSWVDGMAASACLYAISYTNRIIAHQPTDMVGCVGTMMTVSGWPKFRRDSDGYVQLRIYADQSEEKNADYEAALEGNAQIIKENVLNPLAEMFIRDMKANRPASTDDQLKGRTYFARDVVGTLIDSIGTFDDAVNEVIALAQAAQKNNTSQNQMAKYNRIESIPELQEQVYAEDGSTVLQGCQLDAIERALSNPRPEENDLRGQIESLNAQIASNESRIQELQQALDAAQARQDGEAPAVVHVDADPANEPEGSFAPAKSYADACKVCQAYLNRNNN